MHTRAVNVQETHNSYLSCTCPWLGPTRLLTNHFMSHTVYREEPPTDITVDCLRHNSGQEGQLISNLFTSWSLIHTDIPCSIAEYAC